jgi:hypothetical protein
MLKCSYVETAVKSGDLDFAIKSAISHSENMLNVGLINLNTSLLSDYKGNKFLDVLRNNFGLIIAF